MSDQKISKIKEYIEEIDNMKKNESQIDIIKEDNNRIEEKKGEEQIADNVEEKKVE